MKQTTLYNDADLSHRQYNKKVIDIPLTGQHAYNSLTIQLPARGGEGAYLTLCEVQIFGRMFYMNLLSVMMFAVIINKPV